MTTETEREVRTWVRVLVALMAGLLVFILLLPVRGVDTLPPTCWSMFDYVVPCGGGLSFIAGAATAGVVNLVLKRIRLRT